MFNKKSIIQNFNSNASWYELYAIPQQKIASKLASLSQTILANKEHMLEIGCGTGLMTEQIIKMHPTSTVVATDISSNMIEMFKNKYPNILCGVMDGSKPDVDLKFDAIYSNLTFQWFSDLSEIIPQYKEYLNDNGALVFSTLLDTNFPQWQEACTMAKLPHYQDNFLSEIAILKALEPYFDVRIELEVVDMKFKSSLDFLAYIRNIGAKVGKGTSVAKLRKACQYIELNKENTVSYYVAYIMAIKR